MRTQNQFRSLLPLAIAASLALAQGTTITLGAAAKKTEKSSAGVARSEKPATLVDLNTATEEQLQEVPGIGPAYAKKIVAARPYTTISELSKSGIPASRLEKIMPLVTVKAKAAATTEKPAATAKTPRITKTEATAKTDEKAEKAEKPVKKPASTTAQQAPPRKGMVWANTDSKIYHLEGSRWYGKTQQGQWMTEEEAVKQGFRKSKQ
jgi:hypothetical protein